MSILLDQCVPRRYLRLLREWGYEVTLLQEHLRPDAPDVEIARLAKDLDAVLLTVDRGFASILDYPPQEYAGIIVLRYRPQDEMELASVLKQALHDLYRDRLRGVLVVITPHRYRVRHPDTGNR